MLRADGLSRKHDWDNWRKRKFAAAVKANGVSISRPYDLRHGIASLWYREGIDKLTIADWLGHSLAVLESTYAWPVRSLDPRDRRTVDGLGGRTRVAGGKLKKVRLVAELLRVGVTHQSVEPAGCEQRLQPGGDVVQRVLRKTEGSHAALFECLARVTDQSRRCLRTLAQQGLRVARRTITKYRALMRMPSVDVRRADMRKSAA